MYFITLTSDFGLKNHYAASVKGKILSHISNVQLIDISHQISPYNLQQAVYIFKNAYMHFPKNTIHFVFNDLYANKKNKLLYVYENGHHIFCPDNGFITLLFEDKPIKIYTIQETLNSYNYLEVAWQYCRVVESLIQESSAYLRITSIDQIVVKQSLQFATHGDEFEAQVLYIDEYGNVILNLTNQYFEELRKGRSFKIKFMRDEEISKIHRHYYDVAVNEKLCLFNAGGYLEIAINKGNAARLFGFEDFSDAKLFYTKVKIYFDDKNS